MDKAILARVEKQAWFHRYPRGIPFALFLVSLVATLLVVASFERIDAEARHERLRSDANTLAYELHFRGAENIAYLKAAASLFSVSEAVSQAEFTGFVRDISTDWRTRGSLGLGWARLMTAAEANAYQKDQIDSRERPFLIRPAPRSLGTRMAIVTFLEPATRENVTALGYDMYSDERRRAAIDKAIRTGRPAVTDRVHLVQDTSDEAATGFLIYLAVFDRPADGAPGRRGALKGLVYSPVRAQEFLDAAIARMRGGSIEAALYEGEAVEQNLLATSSDPVGIGEGMSRPVTIGDRQWTLLVGASSPEGLSDVSRLTIVFGTMLSLLLLALAWFATSRAAEDRQVLEWLSRQSAIRTSLTRELNHRVKNTLANVLSIVALTRRRSENIEDFAEGLTGRIRALSATHDLLSERDWKDAPLKDVVTSELAPYLDPDDRHVDLDGPDVLLAPNDALSLGLALHELATNAAKYGALSTSDGRVEVSWRMVEPGVCEVNWREHGGPPVNQPKRRGFGVELIEKIVSHELKASVELTFEKAGVRCRLKVPVREQQAFAIRGGAPQ